MTSKRDENEEKEATEQDEKITDVMKTDCDKELGTIVIETESQTFHSLAVPESIRPIPLAPLLPNSPSLMPMLAPNTLQPPLRGQLPPKAMIKHQKKMKCLHWIPVKELEV
jgi:hypothetical protein